MTTFLNLNDRLVAVDSILLTYKRKVFKNNFHALKFLIVSKISKEPINKECVLNSQEFLLELPPLFGLLQVAILLNFLEFFLIYQVKFIYQVSCSSTRDLSHV